MKFLVLALVLVASTCSVSIAEFVDHVVPTDNYHIPTKDDSILSLRHDQDISGSYGFSYETGQSSRAEKRSNDGSVVGSYSFPDENNIVHLIQYKADSTNGFQITNPETLPATVTEDPKVVEERLKHIEIYNHIRSAMLEALAAAPKTEDIDTKKPEMGFIPMREHVLPEPIESKPEIMSVFKREDVLPENVKPIEPDMPDDKLEAIKGLLEDLRKFVELLKSLSDESETVTKTPEMTEMSRMIPEIARIERKIDTTFSLDNTIDVSKGIVDDISRGEKNNFETVAVHDYLANVNDLLRNLNIPDTFEVTESPDVAAARLAHIAEYKRILEENGAIREQFEAGKSEYKPDPVMMEHKIPVVVEKKPALKSELDVIGDYIINIESVLKNLEIPNSGIPESSDVVAARNAHIEAYKSILEYYNQVKSNLIARSQVPVSMDIPNRGSNVDVLKRFDRGIPRSYFDAKPTLIMKRDIWHVDPLPVTETPEVTAQRLAHEVFYKSVLERDEVLKDLNDPKISDDSVVVETPRLADLVPETVPVTETPEVALARVAHGDFYKSIVERDNYLKGLELSTFGEVLPPYSGLFPIDTYYGRITPIRFSYEIGNKDRIPIV